MDDIRNTREYFPPRVLLVDTTETSAKIELVLKALASEKRIGILHLLSSHMYSINEIAELMEMPASTTTMHITILETAGLVRTELKPASRGLQKICARVYDNIEIRLPRGAQDEQEQMIDVSMPVGAYVDCLVAPTCGLVGENGMIGEVDVPATFYHPDRIYAQLLWFRHGYVEYRFPNSLPSHMALNSLQFSLELCSEAPLSNPDWPSNVTMWINGVEIGTWTSPGDFGGQRGALTPLWWEEWNTQYGLLKTWRVTDEGSYIDGTRASGVTLAALSITENSYITLRIGVKNEDTPGGVNIFGCKFGNYPQDIRMRMRCRSKVSRGSNT